MKLNLQTKAKRKKKKNTGFKAITNTSNNFKLSPNTENIIAQMWKIHKKLISYDYSVYALKLGFSKVTTHQWLA